MAVRYVHSTKALQHHGNCVTTRRVSITLGATQSRESLLLRGFQPSYRISPWSSIYEGPYVGVAPEGPETIFVAADLDRIFEIINELSEVTA